MHKNAEGYLNTGDGHKLYWGEYGNPLGKPLLLIHGGAGFIFDIEKMTGIDGNMFRVIAWHQRGMGLSTPYADIENNTVTANLSDIELLRRKLDIQKCSILSWSFGATYMAAHAQDHPEQCHRLLAYAPYLGSNDDYQIMWQQDPAGAAEFFSHHNANTGKEVALDAFNKAASPNWHTRFENYYDALKIFGDTPPIEEVVQSYTLEEWDNIFRMRLLAANLDRELQADRGNFLKERAAPVDHSTSLIYGAKDRWSAPHSYARGVFPKSEIQILPCTSHDIHSDSVQVALKSALA